MYVSHSVSYLASVYAMSECCLYVGDGTACCVCECVCVRAHVCCMWVCLLCLSAVFLSIPLFLFSDGYQYKGKGHAWSFIPTYVPVFLSLSCFLSPSLSTGTDNLSLIPQTCLVLPPPLSSGPEGKSTVLFYAPS